MPRVELTDEELTKFGVVHADEGPHEFDPADEWWNESWFWDWFDSTGKLAGHCRIGIHPNQDRAWIWFFLHREGEWVVIEEPRLPLSHLKLPELTYDGWGLKVSYQPGAPLRSGHLHVEGFGRVVSGPRVGRVLPIGADLEITSLGAPHSPGRGQAAGHSSETVPASRFEQPIAVQGSLRFDTESIGFEGRGERDHSWGPRHWNLEWTVLVLNGEDLRLQCHEARVPNAGIFTGGYLHRDTSVEIGRVDLDFKYNDESLREPVSGSFELEAKDGTVVAGTIEVVAAAEIDITHTFVPPQRSVYRRALIRAHRRSAPPLLGWTEFNRLRAKP